MGKSTSRSIRYFAICALSPDREPPERRDEEDAAEHERGSGAEVEPYRRDARCGSCDDRADDGDDARRGDERLRRRRPLAHRHGGLEDAEVVVVLARDEVGLQLRLELEIGVANAVHPLRPARVLPVDLREAHDRDDPEEVHDRKQNERECDECVAEVGRLGDQCECYHRTSERRDEDRGPAHRLGVDQASCREQAPVLGRQDLQRVRAEGVRRRRAMRRRNARRGVGLEHGWRSSLWRPSASVTRCQPRYWSSRHDGTGASSSSARPPSGSAYPNSPVSSSQFTSSRPSFTRWSSHAPRKTSLRSQ